MGITHRQTLPRELCRWFILAVVLLFGLCQSGATSASSVSSSAGFDAEEHAQHCKCGPKCRQASCCCGPRNTKVRPSNPQPVPEPIRADSSLCLSSAPCGESGLPPAPSSVGPLGKVAALALRGHLLSADSGSLLPVSPRCLLPARRASRLDKPPEHLTLA